VARGIPWVVGVAAGGRNAYVANSSARPGSWSVRCFTGPRRIRCPVPRPISSEAEYANILFYFSWSYDTVSDYETKLVGCLFKERRALPLRVCTGARLLLPQNTGIYW